MSALVLKGGCELCVSCAPHSFLDSLCMEISLHLGIATPGFWLVPFPRERSLEGLTHTPIASLETTTNTLLHPPLLPILESLYFQLVSLLVLRDLTGRIRGLSSPVIMTSQAVVTMIDNLSSKLGSGIPRVTNELSTAPAVLLMTLMIRVNYPVSTITPFLAC